MKTYGVPFLSYGSGPYYQYAHIIEPSPVQFYILVTRTQVDSVARGLNQLRTEARHCSRSGRRLMIRPAVSHDTHGACACCVDRLIKLQVWIT